MDCAKEAAAGSGGGDGEAECNSLYEMDELWHLCEIFFVRKPMLLRTGGLVLQVRWPVS